MKHELKIIIDEYFEMVRVVCENLLNGLNLKNKYDFYEYRKSHNLWKFNINGVEYNLHGIGCYAVTEEFYVNWDFGYRSRWCGVDPWFIAGTLQENKDIRIKYYNGNIIKAVCEQEVINGGMFKKASQYYFTILESDTFKPTFPKEYDSLIIKHFDKQWVLPKSKSIDRFMKKSSRIYNEITNSPNPYTLTFVLNNEEIYTVLYDDIGYPEKAIVTMDGILRELNSVIS